MPDAITPYNFVPLPSVVEQSDTPTDFDQSKWYSDRHTGWIDVEYEALTPIFTRSDKDTVEFAHYGDQAPVLTGSSLRGMVRAAFEIFTASRMEFVADRRYYYRYFASREKNLQHQYITNFRADTHLVAGKFVETSTGLVLRVASMPTKGFVVLPITDSLVATATARYQAIPGFFMMTATRRGLLRDPANVGAGHWFKVPEVNSCPAGTPGAVGGWLMIPGPELPLRPGGTPRHHFQVIIEPDTNYTDYPIPEDVYDDYLTWGQMAHGSRFGTADAPRKLRDGAPAFAVLNGPLTKVATLGANMMVALRYLNGAHTVRDREQGTSSRPASTSPDMAQSVFGTVSDRKGGFSIRGRVFFEDARWQRPEGQAALPWLDGANGIRNALLSSPKPTAIQTYLKQGPDPDPAKPTPDALRHWDSSDACLRGFKRYWHRSAEAANAAIGTGIVNNSQSTNLRPVKPTTKFRGRIRFENLTTLELGALLYSTLLWQGAAHKFGMGKSLGLGSLKAKLVGISLLDIAQRYSSFATQGYRSRTDVEPIYRLAKVYAERISGQRSEASSPEGIRFAAAKILFRLPPEAEPARTQWDNRTRQLGINDGPQWKQRYRLVRAIEVHRPG